MLFSKADPDPSVPDIVLVCPDLLLCRDLETKYILPALTMNIAIIINTKYDLNVPLNIDNSVTLSTSYFCDSSGAALVLFTNLMATGQDISGEYAGRGTS